MLILLVNERKRERQSADTCHIYTVLFPASPAGTRRPKKKKVHSPHQISHHNPGKRAKKEEKGVVGDKQKEQKVRKKEAKEIKKRKEKGQRERVYW